MNTINLIGNIATNLELQQSMDKEHNYCRFTIATNHSFSKETDFINCIVWGNLANNLCKYQNKGSKIAINGYLHTYSYETKTGEKKYSYDVVVRELEYLGNSKPKENEKVETTTKEADVDPFLEYGKTIEIDDTFLD